MGGNIIILLHELQHNDQHREATSSEESCQGESRRHGTQSNVKSAFLEPGQEALEEQSRSNQSVLLVAASECVCMVLSAANMSHSYK